MKPIEYYQTPQISCPNIDDYRLYNVYGKDLPTQKNVTQQEVEILREKYKNLIVSYGAEVGDYDAYYDAKRRYYDECDRLKQEFFADLAEEYGVVDHPKLFILNKLVYKYGNADYYDSMLSLYEDLVELLR